MKKINNAIKIIMPSTTPCCCTKLAKRGICDFYISDSDPMMLLKLVKEIGINIDYPDIITQEDLYKLLIDIMNTSPEKHVEVDCAAVVQIIYFMCFNEVCGGNFKLGFGSSIWSIVTNYQRKFHFNDIDIHKLRDLSTLSTLTTDNKNMEKIVRTLDVVCITFNSTVSDVTNYSKSYQSHWLIVVHNNDGGMPSFIGIHKNKLKNMSLSEWFDFMVSMIDEEINMDRGSMPPKLSQCIDPLRGIHMCYKELGRYKFETAVDVIVIGSIIPACDYLAMYMGVKTPTSTSTLTPTSTTTTTQTPTSTPTTPSIINVCSNTGGGGCKCNE
jgi:hypothetical protein